MINIVSVDYSVDKKILSYGQCGELWTKFIKIPYIIYGPNSNTRKQLPAIQCPQYAIKLP